jgi:hypothetical protein
MTTFWVADGSRTESSVADVVLDSVTELPDRLPPFEPLRS